MRMSPRCAFLYALSEVSADVVGWLLRCSLLFGANWGRGEKFGCDINQLGSDLIMASDDKTTEFASKSMFDVALHRLSMDFFGDLA